MAKVINPKYETGVLISKAIPKEWKGQRPDTMVRFIMPKRTLSNNPDVVNPNKKKKFKRFLRGTI